MRTARSRQSTVSDSPRIGRPKDRSDVGLYGADGSRLLGTSEAGAGDFVREQPGTAAAVTSNADNLPLSELAEDWLRLHRVEWKSSTAATVRINLDVHIIPRLGHLPLAAIDRTMVLDFRARLAQSKGRSKGRLSNDRINHVMTTLRQLLAFSSEDKGVPNPFAKIKALKIARPEVQPFTLEEVMRILESVRPDFRSYYTVRFFTGLRTGEIDGLRWRYVDLERRLIRVRETVVDGKPETPKTAHSARDVRISARVQDALVAQQQVTGGRDNFVFANLSGGALDHRNVTKRVWYPLLKRLGLERRAAYQTRHTCASLWLAAGENPEWIAKQLGHADSSMLFKVYARFVPDLYGNDGAATEERIAQFERDRNARSRPPTLSQGH